MNKEEHVRAKVHLMVLQGDRNKVNIQGSKKPVVSKLNIKSKYSYPFHSIPHTICP